MLLGIGAVFKNETHIMIEWIDHYLFHGVDHIYLINDHSTDNINIIKDMYKNNNKVTFFDSDVDSGPWSRQVDIYNKYLLNEIKKYDWFGILDLDEFLYCPNFINFKEALNKIPSHINQIFANWVTFGSNFHEKQPYSVVKNFTMRISDILDPNFKSHKNLFRPKALLKLDIHTHNVSGESANFSQETKEVLFLINHYVIQSKSFFKNVKSTRGDVNKIVSASFRDDNYFNRYDKNDILDLRLYEQNNNIIDNNINSIIEFHEKYVPFKNL